MTYVFSLGMYVRCGGESVTWRVSMGVKGGGEMGRGGDVM